MECDEFKWMQLWCFFTREDSFGVDLRLSMLTAISIGQWYLRIKIIDLSFIYFTQ